MNKLTLRRIAANALLAIAILAIMAASADSDSPVSEAHFFTHIFGCAAIAGICLYGLRRLSVKQQTKHQ